jgi:hypothetical protein
VQPAGRLQNWLAYPVTDPRRFDTLHSALAAGEIECNLII